MSQSSFIAAALLFAFVLFLASKGRLTAYTAVLWGNTAGASTAAVPSAQSSPVNTAISEGASAGYKYLLSSLFGGL